MVDIRGFSHHQGSSTSGTRLCHHTSQLCNITYCNKPYRSTVSVPYCTKPCITTENHNILHIAVHKTMPYNCTPYHTVPNHTISYYTMPSYTNHTVKYDTIPVHTMIAYAKPYNTTLPYYHTRLPCAKLPIAQPLHFLLPHFSLFHPILFVPFIFSRHRSHLALSPISVNPSNLAIFPELTLIISTPSIFFGSKGLSGVNKDEKGLYQIDHTLIHTVKVHSTWYSKGTLYLIQLK